MYITDRRIINNFYAPGITRFPGIPTSITAVDLHPHADPILPNLRNKLYEPGTYGRIQIMPHSSKTVSVSTKKLETKIRHTHKINKLTQFEIAYITKMIFLKLWVLFYCSEQPI